MQVQNRCTGERQHCSRAIDDGTYTNLDSKFPYWECRPDESLWTRPLGCQFTKGCPVSSLADNVLEIEMAICMLALSKRLYLPESDPADLIQC
jgi:hypothetical protein